MHNDSDVHRDIENQVMESLESGSFVSFYRGHHTRGSRESPVARQEKRTSRTLLKVLREKYNPGPQSNNGFTARDLVEAVVGLETNHFDLVIRFSQKVGHPLEHKPLLEFLQILDEEGQLDVARIRMEVRKQIDASCAENKSALAGEETYSGDARDSVYHALEEMYKDD